MSPSDLIFAAMLLSAPVGTPEQVPPPDRWQTIQSAIHHTAIDWEILDARETRYVLAKPEDFQEDLDFLRKRRADLEEAPKVGESDRLPSRQAVNDNIRFNRAYRKNLETRMLWEPDRANVIGEAIRETERLYKMWDAIRDAKCEFHYVTVRRLALKRLMEMVGPEVYLTGELPPYVPEWRFAVVQ
jgi:hypothetical protein